MMLRRPDSDAFAIGDTLALRALLGELAQGSGERSML